MVCDVSKTVLLFGVKLKWWSYSLYLLAQNIDFPPAADPVGRKPLWLLAFTTYLWNPKCLPPRKCHVKSQTENSEQSLLCVLWGVNSWLRKLLSEKYKTSQECAFDIEKSHRLRTPFSTNPVDLPFDFFIISFQWQGMPEFIGASHIMTSCLFRGAKEPKT